MKKISKLLIGVFLIAFCFNSGSVNAEVKNSVAMRALNSSSQLEALNTSPEHIKMLAMVYMNKILKGDGEGVMQMHSNYLKPLMSADVIKSLSKNLNSFGKVKLVSVSYSKNAVHQNVTLKYSSTLAGYFIYNLKFDYNALIDDVSLGAVPEKAVFTVPSYDKHNYIEKEVAFGDGEWRLPGTLTIPKGNGPFPVVVLVHGSGPADRDETVGGLKPFKDLAVGLAANNIAVLRYEKRTLEHPSKSAGIKKITVYDETINDAEAAVKYLSSLKEIDPSRIYVIGHSQGAMLIPRILKADSNNLIKAAVVMSGPARPLNDIMLEQFQYLISLGIPAQAQLDAYKSQFDILKSSSFNPDNPPAGYSLGMPYWWNDLKSYNPVKDAEDIAKPVLVLQGARDYQVSAEKDYKVWKDTLSDKNNFSFILYPKLNHMYTEGEGPMSTPYEYYNPSNIPEYVIKDIANFINK